MRKIKIICTIGPSSKKSIILKKLKLLKIDLYRINLSHTKIVNLKKDINFISKYSELKKICIDTEGAQVRMAQIKKSKILKKNQLITLGFDKQCDFILYPKFKVKKINKNSEIEIGFDDLKLSIIKFKNNKFYCRVVSSGKIESNKGVHFRGLNFRLPPLTNKDIEAIKIAKVAGVKNYALSFVNSYQDVKIFRSMLPKKSLLISKIETKNALKNLKKIIEYSDEILIDRGDLSRYIPVYKIPIEQMKILSISSKPVNIATNLLETMVNKKSPTRAEANDIYQSLYHGAKGLVLAAETAIGKYPIEAVKFIKACIKAYN
jgi:pyruvate kinase